MSASTHSPVLKHHFDNLEQQHAAERLGMWMFLVTEVMFFGGLFAAYTAYRYYFPFEFELASSHLTLWIAGLNTALLITSSLTMTFAIRAAQKGNKKALITHLWLTFLLGAAFLGFKALEYKIDFDEHLIPGPTFASSHLAKEGAEQGASVPRLQLFYCFYYVMTGIHGIHILVGLGCILWLICQAYQDKIPRENYSTVEVISLYWHLVDMIWLFLMPLLYLTGAGLKHGH